MREQKRLGASPFREGWRDGRSDSGDFGAAKARNWRPIVKPVSILLAISLLGLGSLPGVVAKPVFSLGGANVFVGLHGDIQLRKSMGESANQITFTLYRDGVRVQSDT